MSAECAHCEKWREVDELGLCERCAAVVQVRALYVRRRGWSPAWEERLRALRRRAMAGLPLFPRRREAGERGA